MNSPKPLTWLVTERSSGRVVQQFRGAESRPEADAVASTLPAYSRDTHRLSVDLDDMAHAFVPQRPKRFRPHSASAIYRRKQNKGSERGRNA